MCVCVCVCVCGTLLGGCVAPRLAFFPLVLGRNLSTNSGEGLQLLDGCRCERSTAFHWLLPSGVSLSLSLFFFPPRLADSERSFVEISVCVLPIFVHCLTFFISPPPKRCFLRSDRRPLSDVNRVNGVNSSSTWHRTTNRIRRPCFLNRLAQSIYQV